VAYEPVIKYAERIAELTLNGTVIKGQPVAYNGTGWVAADASDAATNLYAQYIAMAGGLSGAVIQGCKSCVLLDEDAPFTANALYYVSATAGGITSTRPTTDGDVIQVIGQAVSTSELKIDIKPVEEFEIFLSPDTYDGTGEPGLGVVDTGWPGPGVDGAEAFYFKGRLPSGLVGALTAAKVVLCSTNASAADIDVSVVGGYDGASNARDTGAAITAGDWSETDADNILLTMDISSCFDADFLKAGENFAVLVDPDGITGEVVVIGLYIRGTKV
jgi:hypothetical protein